MLAMNIQAEYNKTANADENKIVVLKFYGGN